MTVFVRTVCPSVFFSLIVLDTGEDDIELIGSAGTTTILRLRGSHTGKTKVGMASAVKSQGSISGSPHYLNDPPGV